MAREGFEVNQVRRLRDGQVLFFLLEDLMNKRMGQSASTDQVNSQEVTVVKPLHKRDGKELIVL